MSKSVIILILISNFIYAQNNINIILNPSFEEGETATATPMCDYTYDHHSDSSYDIIEFNDDVKDWRVAFHGNCPNIRNTPDWYSKNCAYNQTTAQYTQHDFYPYNCCNVNYDYTAPSNRFIFLRSCYNNDFSNCKGKERSYEAIYCTLNEKLVKNETYILKLKIKPIQKQFLCGQPGDYEEIYTGINELDVHFTEKGNNWDSNTNNQKWMNAAIVWKDFNDPGTCCCWEQVVYEITVPNGKSELKNMILYCQEGAYFIDDVELYKKCPDEILFENKEFNIHNHPYSYMANNKIIAGNDVDPNSTNGDVLVNSTGSVVFIAGDEVRLTHGFRTNGGEFHAYNAPCMSNKSMMVENTTGDYYNQTDTAVIVEKTKQAADSDELKLYPNPAKEKIYIESDNVSFIELLDLSGKVLIQRKTNEYKNTIEVKNLNPGLYFIKVYQKDRICTEKVIIM